MYSYNIIYNNNYTSPCIYVHCMSYEYSNYKMYTIELAHR